jgi:uncharacterized membrane protein
MAEKRVAPEGDITQDDKTWGMLCWIPFVGFIVALIILFTEEKKQRPFMKYNAVQSLVLGVIGSVVSSLLSAIFVGCFTGIAWVVYAIILALKANKGEWVTIPVITDFCKNQGWV